MAAAAIALGSFAACTLVTDLDGFSTRAVVEGDGAPGDARATTTLADGRVLEPDGGDRSCAADLTTDTHNCGQCGKDCLGGECKNARCGPAVLARGFDRPLGIGLSQGKLYVGHTGALTEVSLDGKETKPVVTDVRVRYVWGTEADVFFVNERNASILRWAHTSDGKTDFVLGAPNVSGVALSPMYVYYTRYIEANKGGGVYRAPIGGGAPELLEAWNYAESVAWADGKVYFAGDGQDSANLLNDDGSIDELLDRGGPTGIFVLGDDAFITRQGAGELLRVPLSTREPQRLASGLDQPSGVVATASAIYWVELGPGTLGVLVR